MMQFLAFLHILLTCSFVLLLAYVLSTIFSYLASSVIHGGSTKVRKRGVTHAPRSGRPPNVEVEQELVKAGIVMDRLPEVDEEEDDVYENAQMPAATIAKSRGFELADVIFDNRIAEEGLGSNGYAGQTNEGIAEENMKGRGKLNRVGASGRWHDDEEGKMGNGELEEAENEGKYGEAEYRKIENGSSWDKKEGEAVARESSGSSSGNSSKLGDAQGSSSPQQRLPPTWSDLEKMVKLNSTKDLLAL